MGHCLSSNPVSSPPSKSNCSCGNCKTGKLTLRVKSNIFNVSASNFTCRNVCNASNVRLPWLSRSVIIAHATFGPTCGMPWRSSTVAELTGIGLSMSSDILSQNK